MHVPDDEESRVGSVYVDDTGRLWCRFADGWAEVEPAADAGMDAAGAAYMAEHDHPGVPTARTAPTTDHVKRVKRSTP